MAFVVGELAAPISGDTKGFDKDLDKVKKAGERAADAISKRFRNVGQSISNTGGTLTKFVTGPMLAAGAGMLLLANRTATYADEIDKTSIRTGIARETLQELRFVADQTGVEFSALQGVVESFTRRIPQLESGTSESAQAFKRLGVDLRDSQGNMRSVSNLFPELISGLARMQNATERNAIATQIFGRRAFEIVPLLEAGEQGIAELTARAHELGLVMSDEAIKSAVDYKDAMSELKQEFAAVGRDLALKFMPIIKNDLIPIIRETLIPMFQKFVEWIAKVTKEFSELDEGTQKLVLSLAGLALVGGPVLKVVGTLTKAVAGLKGVVVLLLKPAVALAAALAGITAGTIKLSNNMAKTKIEAGLAGESVMEFNDILEQYGWNVETATKGTEANTRSLKENTETVNTNVQAIGKISEILDGLIKKRNEILDVNRQLTGSELEQVRAIDMQVEALERLQRIREQMVQSVQRMHTVEQDYQTTIKGVPTLLEPIEAATNKVTEAIQRMTVAEMEALKWSMMRADETIKSARDVASAVVAEARRVITAKFAEAMAAILADAGFKFGIFAPVVGVGIASAFSAFWNSFVKLAKGGIIPSGYPNDSFPAMLTSGEAVIPLDRQKEFGTGGNMNLNIHLTGEMKARDNDLAFIINRIIQKRTRLT
jgi:hypothetical protein